MDVFCYFFVTRMKEPVRLRRKALKNGEYSLYLDIYVDGKRSYEFLKLYIMPEKTKADKERNRQTMATANAVKAQRILEIQNQSFGLKTRRNVYLFDYVEVLANEKENVNSQGTWRNFIKHLREFEHGDPRLSDVDVRWVDRFKSYLAGAKSFRDGCSLKQNSQSLYFSKLKAVFNAAEREGLIDTNPAKASRGISHEASQRQYLTVDELRRLAATQCDDEEVKRAFLFSCLTGLRRSDVEALTWSDVRREGEFTRLVFTQQKTAANEYLDITPEASLLIGEPMDGDRYIFKLKWKPQANRIIGRWCRNSGIEKHITYHSSRHTFAVIMLMQGVDIYVVSKLLGHRELSTTQIYAHIVDKAKQEAVAKMPLILDTSKK